MRDHARQGLGIAALAASLVACTSSLQSSFDPLRTSRAPMAIQAYARSLLYVATTSVQVFTYPKGRPVGSLGLFDDYICSDGFGNIFVAGAEGISYVWVYPHGSGTPIATLYNPQSPGGCAVGGGGDRLAVADPDASPIVIFRYKSKRGWRLARQYTDFNVRASIYCAYDPEGNLFLDGYSTTGAFILVELPKGSSTFTTITLDHVIHSPGSVQWDGKDLAIEDAGTTRSSAAVIYRFAINGSHGHKVSATTLTGSAGDAQFLIHGSTVIGPLSSQGIGFWHFPRGGAPVKTISTYSHAQGEALSLK